MMGIKSKPFAMIVGAVLGTGCIQHAELQPAAPNASAQARIDAYKRLHPREQDTVTRVTISDGHTVAVSQSMSLILGDGTTVEAPEDLIPVVPRDSSTARSAQRAADARHRARVWSLVGWGSVIVGSAVMLYAGTQMAHHDATGTADLGIPTTFWVGAGVGIVGSMVGSIGAVINGHEAAKEGRSAFATYDDSLRAGLGVCVHKLKVVDCASRPADSDDDDDQKSFATTAQPGDDASM